VAIAIGFALIAVGLAVTLLRSEEPYTGENGREIQLPAAVVIPAKARACQPEPSIPSGSGTVGMQVSTAGREAGPIEVSVLQGGRTVGTGRSRGGVVDEPVRVKLGGAVGGLEDVRLCVTNAGTRRVAVLGQEAAFGTGARISDPDAPQTRAMRLVWFEADKQMVLGRAGEVAHRYGLVKASWVGTWTFWAALVALLLVSGGAAALVAREVRRS
jgi:hypothetical protein